MLENYINKVMNNPEPQPIKYDMNSNFYLNPNMLVEKFSNIALLEDDELLNLLCSNYQEILKDIFENENKHGYLSMFLNSRFISIFTQAISMSYQPNINNYKYRVYMNKIVYDYIIRQNKSETIKNLMLGLSRVVNMSMIAEISALGITNDFATVLALTRYSSDKEEINIRRVILIILSLPLDMITINVLVDLLGTLFDRMGLLFETIMLECTIDNEGIEEEGEMYGRISNAILIQLENMRMEDIYAVIKSYADDYRLMYAGEPYRFSLHAINNSDYPRINQVVDLLTENNVIIP